MLLDANGNPQPGPLLVRNGTIVALGSEAIVRSQADARRGALMRIPLPGCLLVPGFANAHSHAFQRALRGRVETRAQSAPEDDFWSWRHEMYRIALSLDLDAVEAVAAWCYTDMVRAGFVSVGEFQYLHHDEAGQPYADPAAVSERLARAAHHAGIRLVLLQCAYERAGWCQSPHPEQRRFVFPRVEDFLEFSGQVRSRFSTTISSPAEEHTNVRHGFALHSVRACSGTWLESVAEESKRLDLPLHIHACEQPAELAACQQAEGVGPIEWLDRCGVLYENTTLVHATHVNAADIERMSRQKVQICICPSTERNLGDGLAPIREFQAAGIPICIGTDSHARIDALEEIRSLEEHERARTLRRNVLAAPGASSAPALLAAGIRVGAKSLGLPSPDLCPGAPADFVAFDLPLEAAGEPRRAFDALWVGGCSRADVHAVFVSGRTVYRKATEQAASLAPYESILRRILGALSDHG